MTWVRRTLPIVLLTLLPFAFHWKLFASDPAERTIFRGDFLNQHYAWKSYALSRVERGELPLWNPHVLGGVAIHANPQAAIFYPPSYLLLPFVEDGRVSYEALEAYQLLHQAFAGLGMWLLIRSFGIGNLGALMAAIVFMFTGFFTTPGHHAIIVTASWLPWSLGAVRYALDTERATRAVAVMAIAFAGFVLGGHPQVYYYGMLLTAAFALTTLGWRQALSRFVPAGVLAVGIAAVQLVPTFELAQASSRAELGYEYSASFGLSPYFLAAAFVPRGQVPLPGQEAAAPLHLYVGVGTLLLAAIGVSLSSHQRRWFFAASALLALFLSFGRDSPLFDGFYASVPGFDRFRVPYRLLGLYAGSMAVLAGYGVQALADAGGKTRRRIRSICWVSFAVLVLLAAWAAAMHTSVTAPGALPPEQFERLVGGAYWAVLLGALNVGLLVIWLWRARERWVIPLLVAVATLDLGAFVKDRGEHPSETFQRAGERLVHRLARFQEDGSRHASESNLENYAMLHGTRSVGGHSALVDARYRELMELSRTSANALALLNAKFIARGGPPSRYPWCGTRYQSPLPLVDLPPELSPTRIEIWPPVTTHSIRIVGAPLSAGDDGAVIEIGGERSRIEAGRPLDLRFEQEQRVSELTIELDPESHGFRLETIELDLNPIGLKADFLIVQGIKVNLHALPRVFFMEPSDVPRERQSIDRLSCWSIYDGVQVDDVTTGEGVAGAFRKHTSSIVDQTAERITIETSSPRDGYVVLADTFRPGWQAFVDGVRQPVLRAQWSMRAAPVPKGTHRVVFEYRPSSLRNGAGITLLSVSSVLVLWFFPRRRVPDEPDLIPDDDFTTEL